MILGIIPARGGSKGVPRKNVKEIAGKPLIAWTIEQAKESKLLDGFVVSTESQEIAEISKQYGAKVLERPAELAKDETSTLSVLRHVIECIPCDVITLLQPTSPVRKPGLIDECIREFIDNKYDSLATGFICKHMEYGTNSLRRQDVSGFFYDDGNVYIIKADFLKNGDRYGKKIGRKITTRYENVEIDDEFDFWVAGEILKEKI